MADAYKRISWTRRVHRLVAILLRRWQAEEIAKTPFPRVSRLWTKHKVQTNRPNMLRDRSIQSSYDLPPRKNLGRCLASLLDRLQKVQQVGVDFVLVRSRETVRPPRIVNFLRSLDEPSRFLC